MADLDGPFTGLTQQDQKLIMGALRSLKGGFEVDYSKLAENMEWFTKDDATKPNVKKANNAWLVTRKRLFPDGVPAGAAPEGSAAKPKTPATPRKKKEPDAPRTPRVKKAATKKGDKDAKDGEEMAATEDAPNTNAVHAKTVAAESAKAADSETEEPSKANLENSDKIAASGKEPSIADSSTPTRDLNAGRPSDPDPVTPITKTSVAGEMSSGSMSPTGTASSTKTKATPATPKAKATPKTQKTPDTGSATSTAEVPLAGTPVTTAPKVTPKKRKTEVEKEARTSTTGEEGGTGEADGNPPAKKRKSSNSKASAQTRAEKEAADPDTDGGESAKTTPVKTPRKPSAAQIAKREQKEREKAAKKAEKEKEKADKKAEKEREKANKQAAKKAAKEPANAENQSPKPKTPRKPSAAQQTKKAENEEAKNASQEAEDEVALEAGVDADADASADATRLSLAAQDMINKKTDDVFNGARIDKQVGVTAGENADPERITGDDASPKPSGFVAINGNTRLPGPIAPSEAVKSTVEVNEKDGEPIGVVEEKVTAVEIELAKDAVAVAEGA